MAERVGHAPLGRPLQALESLPAACNTLNVPRLKVFINGLSDIFTSVIVIDDFVIMVLVIRFTRYKSAW